MKIYLSGPMTGIPFWNKPHFDYWEVMFLNAGHEVFNPASDAPKGDEEVKPWEFYIKRDIDELVKCDALFFLTDWKLSYGAVVEMVMAFKFNKLIMFEEPMDNTTGISINFTFQSYADRETGVWLENQFKKEDKP